MIFAKSSDNLYAPCIFAKIHATQISDFTEGHYFIRQLSFVTSCQADYCINADHSGDRPQHGTYRKYHVYISLQPPPPWWRYLSVSTYRSWAVRHRKLPLFPFNITPKLSTWWQISGRLSHRNSALFLVSPISVYYNYISDYRYMKWLKACTFYLMLKIGNF